MNFKMKKLLKIKTTILSVGLLLFFVGCASNTTAVKATNTDTTESPKLNHITAINTGEDSVSSNVWIKGDSTLTYTSVKQPFPLGVLLYFPETALDDIDNTYTPESAIVKSIKASKLSSKGHTTRLEILLNKDAPYEVTRDFTGIKVAFKKSPLTPVSYEKKPVKEEAVEEIPPSEGTSATANMLASVDTTALENGTEVDINADGIIKNYKALTLDEPPRIVFDLYNVKSPYKTQQAIPVGSKWVKQVRHYGYPDRVRVVLDTEKEYLSAYSAEPVDKGISIKVGDKPNEKQPLPEKKLIAAEASKTDQAEQSGIKNPSPNWINRIDFASEDDGKSTLIVGTTSPVKYDIKKINDKKLLLKLYDTRLPDYRQRPLITTRFNSAVDRIIPFQMPSMKNASLVTIELRESVPYFAEQSDDTLMLHFEASSIPPKTLDEAKLPDWKKVMTQSAMEREEKEAVEPAEAMAMEAQEGRYTGKKIALDFYDADIKNVFRILMDVSGKNFVIDKDVTGKVTLSLEKPVPWDQVLDLVLRMNQLEMVYEGDIVRIITHKTYLAEKKKEQTERAEEQKIKTEEKELVPLVTAYIPINYADANADVLPHVNVLLSPRGKSTVDTRNNKIIVNDIPDVIQKVKETVKQIDQVTPQVIIEARIVEATDSFSRELGTQYGLIAGPYGLGDGDITIDSGAVNPPSSTLGDIGLSFTKLTGDPFQLLDLRLMASETEGQVKIISSPKILTLDNTPASIKQGLAYPYTKLDADGNTVIEFKDIALELEVTPHITPDDRVSMKLTVKNNELGAIINNQTSFTTKEASTELLVDDGDTIVIGGIRKTRKDTSESGVPLLKDIPLLGWLFKTKAKSEDLEELLIFVSPRIVKLEQRAAM